MMSFRRHASAVLAAIAAAAPTTLGGDLNPPAGPVAPTDRVTLNEGSVTLPLTISQPGSYVLTSNLTGVVGQHGIRIEASDVTLDLNGFVLGGVAGSGTGVAVIDTDLPGAAVRNVTIRNGTVRGWGEDGIGAVIDDDPFGSATAEEVVVDRVRLIDNGGAGAMLGRGSIMRDCVAAGNDDGFDCDDVAIIRCTSRGNANTGILARNDSLTVDCHVLENGGFGLNGGGRIERCIIAGNQGGINVGPGTTIADCTVVGNSGFAGVSASQGAHVRGNTVRNNEGFGVFVGNGGQCYIEGNDVNNNGGVGIHATAVGNFISVIVRNNARGNSGGNYNVPGQDAGPITTAAAAVSPTANISN